MRPRYAPLPVALQALLVLAALPAAGAAPQEHARLEVPGPGPAPVDRHHPDGPSADGPRRGGRATVHLESAPVSFNALLDNSAITRRLLFDLHEQLVQTDWETWELVPRLAERVVVEDIVVRADGERIFGLVTREGDEVVVTPPAFPAAAGDLEGGLPHPLSGPVRFPADEVELLPRTVFTFLLRRDVRWHDGHPFDAGDVMFSYACTRNPHVPCEAQRFAFDKLERAERLGTYAVRFHLREPYFLGLAIFGGLIIQPAHLFDLGDPDNPDHRDRVDPAEQARYLIEHPANRRWVGLGPYELTAVTDAYIDAERFEDYFDPERAGHLDAVRWRVVVGDHAAFLALLNGELDFTPRLLAEDYFGERAASAAFREDFYTGLIYTPVMSFTVWNTRRVPFDDARVRRALSMAFDWDAFIAGYYRGLAVRVTSEIYPGSPCYDPGVEPVPHDPVGARKLLAEAGLYDRDGDGWVDRDGAPLEIELLVPAGSATGSAYGQKLAEDLERIGVRLELVAREAASFYERLGQRDFDGALSAWYMPVESDPEQLWHSRWVGPGTGNYGSLADAEVDRLIDALQVEPDRGQRRELFHRLQRRLHDLQVYSYGVFVPKRFAASRRLHGVQTFSVEPGYSIRRWYVED